MCSYDMVLFCHDSKFPFKQQWHGIKKQGTVTEPSCIVQFQELSCINVIHTVIHLSASQRDNYAMQLQTNTGDLSLLILKPFFCLFLSVFMIRCVTMSGWQGLSHTVCDYITPPVRHKVSVPDCKMQKLKLKPKMEPHDMAC